jgi:hypothetical protein
MPHTRRATKKDATPIRLGRFGMAENPIGRDVGVRDYQRDYDRLARIRHARILSHTLAIAAIGCLLAIVFWPAAFHFSTSDVLRPPYVITVPAERVVAP